ncbi:hypothetical protein PO878_05095 [Iamia majanohamensis]|uniref:NHL repeat-containing protein n=1 Tax=Iamia majanohamensis TaxID=467976 RepID=A0AAE9YBR7_9ACTN|nr:hypothetical protein [Iamia majanohamensis]WCO68099.1 hypothetical protein PO878_05095 [Iamia majanohamensis]
MSRTPRHRPRATLGLAAALLLAVLLVPAATAAPAGAQDATVEGRVVVGGTALPGYEVTLHASGQGQLGSATTGGAGGFSIQYPTPSDPSSVLYLLARNPSGPPAPGTITLASVLGTSPVVEVATVTEVTTVAAGFAMAQFTEASTIGGRAPGLQNASAFVGNLADAQGGGVSPILGSAPNGSETSALATFGSLANMVAACVEGPADCTALLAAATPPGGAPPGDTFQAMADIAANPGRSVANVAALFAVSQLGATPNQPARTLPPDAWTLALRFDGDGTSMDGPGNFAIDHEGNLYVVNNYEYGFPASVPVCGSDLLLKFDPTGQYVAGSPFRGGGLSGAGFGVEIDRYGDVWAANFGFAAPEPGCPADRQPPHNSISKFTPDGTPLSPAEGFTGAYDWPQGMDFDEAGTLWVANCDGDSVARLPEGDPDRAEEITDIGVEQPLAVAHTADSIFVTGTLSNNVARLRLDGTPYPDSPIGNPDGTPGAFDYPMGIAADSDGYMWVANSARVDLPCPAIKQIGDGGGSSTLLSPTGEVVLQTEAEAGGQTVPWGIAVDGDDNVWHANFTRRRLSHICGRRVETCPPGVTTGEGISPDGTGYGFDGLVRNTGVAIDQSGNVWLTNNWKDVPVQTNPGGYEIVAYVGLAAPVDRPEPEPRPDPEPTPEPGPTPAPGPAVPALPIRTAARFTG